uniref:Diacylglycerol kinase accessory domain-containing protein n=2 Tax=Arcella intermedia TaxID=1963864 RepID=A0A6B2L5T2_9EUKA
MSDSEETLPVNDLSQSTDTKIFNNYFSIGMDGKICLDFHNFRNKNPELFKNKYVNYGWYGAIGLKSAFTHWTPLSKVVVLRIDGQDIKLPKKLLALVILNIPSYGGGADLWGKNSGYWKKQAIDDRMLEVVGLRGAFHMGQVQSGIAQGRRIGQGRTIEISIENEIEAQIDGEPFKMKSCSTVISWHNQAPVLLNQVKDKNYKQMKKLLQNYNDYEKRENLLTYIEKLEKANYANEDLQFLKECIENVDNPTHLLTIFDQRINRLPPPALPPKPKEWKKFDSAFRTLEHIDLDGVSQPIPKITESEPYTRESEPLSAREPRKKSKKKATAQEKVFSSNTLKPKTVSVESSSPTTEKPSHSKTTRKKHERSRSTSPPKNAITLI